MHDFFKWNVWGVATKCLTQFPTKRLIILMVLVKADEMVKTKTLYLDPGENGVSMKFQRMLLGKSLISLYQF